MPGYDYANSIFSFKTVFYKSAYSYCCCACGYKHEYLEYISADGDINEDLYEAVKENIIAGECPHVVNVCDEYVTLTTIYAVHIAAVVATLNDVKEIGGHAVPGIYLYRKTGIFGLRPYMSAVLKNNVGSVTPFAEYISRHTNHFCNEILEEFVLLANKCHETTDTHILQLDPVTLIELCIRKRNITVLNDIVRPDVYHFNIHRSFVSAFQSQSDDIEEALLQYDMRSLNWCRHPFYVGCGKSAYCAEAALLCNRLEPLRRALYFLSTFKDKEIAMLLYETYTVLQRRHCKSLLLRHGIIQETSADPYVLSDLVKMRRLLHLFQSYRNFDTELITALNSIPEVHKMIDIPYDCATTRYAYALPNKSPLLSYVCANRHIEPLVVKTMLDLGANVDYFDPDGNTPLLCLLKKALPYTEHFRETLALFLYENPDPDVNKSAVDIAIELDIIFHKHGRRMEPEKLRGVYNMDAKEHSLFGHDGTGAYAFNFIGPLLIECGFPVSQYTIVRSLQYNLHETEQRYLTQHLNCPKSLQLFCRDSLRKYFKRRQIHCFVNRLNCPNKIKDFIVLKSILHFT